MDLPGRLVFGFALIVVFLVNIHLSLADKYQPLEVIIPEDGENIQIFTADDLAKFDGSDPDLALYMAVKGVVFDVTIGKNFYGKGASYNALTGKDCTQAVARMSLEPEHLNSDISSLSDEHLKSLDDVFTGTYKAKYPVIGYMDYVLLASGYDPHWVPPPHQEL